MRILYRFLNTRFDAFLERSFNVRPMRFVMHLFSQRKRARTQYNGQPPRAAIRTRTDMVNHSKFKRPSYHMVWVMDFVPHPQSQCEREWSNMSFKRTLRQRMQVADCKHRSFKAREHGQPQRIEAHTQTHTDTHKHTQTHTDTQTHRHTDTQTHRHTHTHKALFPSTLVELSGDCFAKGMRK